MGLERYPRYWSYTASSFICKFKFALQIKIKLYLKYLFAKCTFYMNFSPLFFTSLLPKDCRNIIFFTPNSSSDELFCRKNCWQFLFLKAIISLKLPIFFLLWKLRKHTIFVHSCSQLESKLKEIALCDDKDLPIYLWAKPLCCLKLVWHALSSKDPIHQWLLWHFRRDFHVIYF